MAELRRVGFSVLEGVFFMDELWRGSPFSFCILDPWQNRLLQERLRPLRGDSCDSLVKVRVFECNGCQNCGQWLCIGMTIL
jgi:hypothetical protein